MSRRKNRPMRMDPYSRAAITASRLKRIAEALDLVDAGQATTDDVRALLTASARQVIPVTGCPSCFDAKPGADLDECIAVALAYASDLPGEGSGLRFRGATVFIAAFDHPEDIKTDVLTALEEAPCEP